MNMNIAVTKKADEDKTKSNLKQNKRIGICTECGYEWIGRNTKTEKPPRCPECRGRQCAWEDTLSDEELNELKPLIHGITDTTKKELTAAEAVKPDDTTPPDREPEEQQESEPVETAEPVTIPKKESKPLRSTKPERKEEKPAEKIYIAELKEFATVIENPNTDTEEEKPPVVAWKAKNGEIKYGAVLDTETVEEIEEILETAAEKEVIPTQKDLDVLKAAGILEENGLEFERQVSKTQPQKSPKKAEAKNGIPVIGLVLFAGVAACAVAPMFLTSKSTARNTSNTANAKQSQGYAYPIAQSYLKQNAGNVF